MVFHHNPLKYFLWSRHDLASSSPFLGVITSEGRCFAATSTLRPWTTERPDADNAMAPLPMLMKTTMLLAPWLATQTYACPYAILSAAVAGANPRSGMKINAHMQMTDTRKAVQVAEPPTVVEELLLRNVPTKPAADFLLFKDDAWRSAKALTDPTATISDARLW